MGAVSRVLPYWLMSAKPARAVAACAGLAAIACGGAVDRTQNGADGSSAGATGALVFSGRTTAGAAAAGAASASAAGQTHGTCPVFRVVQDVESRCRRACEKARPVAVDAITEQVCSREPRLTVEVCAERCRSALVEVDEPCASQILDEIDWDAGDHYCNSWECGCSSAAHLRFEEPEGTDPVDACALTIAHRRCLRETSPTPAQIGLGPTVTTEFKDIPARELEMVSGNRLFLAEESYTESSRLGLWSLDGEQLWFDSEAYEIRNHDRQNLVRGGPDRVVLLSAGADEFYGAKITIGDANEMISHRLDLGTARCFGPRKRGGFVTLGENDSYVATFNKWDQDGTLVDSFSVPGVTASDGSWLLETADGDVVITTSKGATTRIMRLSETTSVAWTREYDEAQWSALAESSEGNVVAGGRGIPEGARTYRPLVVAYSTLGEVVWQWWPTTPEVEGGVVAVESDGVGNVYVASTEGPLDSADNSTDVCTVYGCQGIALRKFGPDGAVLMEYQRRNVTSEAYDLAVDSSGRPFVLGRDKRETNTTVLLGFEP